MMFALACINREPLIPLRIPEQPIESLKAWLRDRLIDLLSNEVPGVLRDGAMRRRSKHRDLASKIHDDLREVQPKYVRLLNDDGPTELVVVSPSVNKNDYLWNEYFSEHGVDVAGPAIVISYSDWKHFSTLVKPEAKKLKKPDGDFKLF